MNEYNGRCSICGQRYSGQTEQEITDLLRMCAEECREKRRAKEKRDDFAARMTAKARCYTNVSWCELADDALDDAIERIRGGFAARMTAKARCYTNVSWCELADDALDDALAWIREHMTPEEVFGPSKALGGDRDG